MLAEPSNNNGFMLWIDSVGAWKACLQPRITIGGPALEEKAADISLMANISRKHVTLWRDKDAWFIEPHAETHIGDRLITSPTPLRADSALKLGNRVELSFRIPTALSSTAVLEFVSEHRPAQHVDGIVLVHQNCLLGPGPENHVVCPGWPDSLVLFQRDGSWRCKSRMNIAVDGDIVTDSHEVQTGSVIDGEELRLRIEAV